MEGARLAEEVSVDEAYVVEPQDHGWMYGHGFQDIDGHLWEFAYMDMSAMPQG